jgi:molecular chaperone GrpE (heat shock protein)
MQLNLGRTDETAEAFALEANHLVTHGVILGMTGSGKTGLAITLLEELVLAGVPLMLIDPKGDLANLGLLFPEARADQLQPWLDEGQDSQECSQRVQRGRLEWGIGPSQVAELRDKMELRIYTPGSRVGLPVNLLGCFQRPDAATLAEPEARAELISGTVQGLLALVGVSADPLRSPEAVVLGQIVDLAWEQGQDLSLEDLVLRLADPPFKKVGVFPLETFFPSSQRLDLAMKLNALLASPAFAAWSEGDPLDPQRLQQSVQPGKVPVSLFYLAHLSDAERMFFVSLLLHRVRNWSRGLSGTSSLRSLLYFDEVAGYVPPHPANPASKQPLLTLLKQSRAVGVGLVLATQNPVDIDYKGLANAGTWWVGRMQTAQDRARVAEGLTLAAAGLDGQQLQREFEQLQPRHFLVKSPASPLPLRYQTRFAKSFLRGPVTRAELPRLQPRPPAPVAAATVPGPRPAAASAGLTQPPPLPGGFAQGFLDPRVVFSAALEGILESFAQPRRSDGVTLWQPALWGELQLRFDEDKGGFVLDEAHHCVFFPLGDSLPSQWLRLPLEPNDVLPSYPPPGFFEPLPASFDESSEFKAAQQAMIEDVFRRVSSSQWIQPDLKLYGEGGESEERFRERVQRAIEERVDQQVSKLHAKVDREIQALQDRLARHEGKLETLRNESQRRQTESLWNAGAAVLGFFTGKKRSLNTALSAHHRSSGAKDRVSQSEDEVNLLYQKLQEVREKLELQVDQIRAAEAGALDRIEARTVRLERSDIRVSRFGVLWIPVSRRA